MLTIRTKTLLALIAVGLWVAAAPAHASIILMGATNPHNSNALANSPTELDNQSWPNGDLTLGANGNAGHLEVNGGSDVYIHDFYMSDHSTATITGTDSVLHSRGYWGFTVDTGTLNIEAGAYVEGDGVTIGQAAGSNATVNVTGAGSELYSVTWQGLVIGEKGNATLNIEDGGYVYGYGINIGEKVGSNGMVNVIGADSILHSRDGLSVGEEGVGIVNIKSGARVSTGGGFFNGHPTIGSVTIGGRSGSSGAVNVVGNGSTLDSSWFLEVGHRGSGILNVKNGGDVIANGIGIGEQNGSTGTVTVNGAGSSLQTTSISVGGRGTGTLKVEDGGDVSADRVYIGDNSGSIGTVTVTDGGSTLRTNEWLVVGSRGDGTLNIENEGLVDLGDDLTLARHSGSSGTVNLTGGTLNLNGHDVAFGDGNATFNFTGGTLAGVGHFGSGLNQQGGTLQIGNSPGTMTIHGDYTQSSDSILEMEIFSGSVFDVLNVTGNAFLAGTIELIFGDSYDPTPGDTFDLFNFGSFSDSGYSIDLMNFPTVQGMSWDFDFDGNGTGTFRIARNSGTPNAVPAPGTLALLGLGLLLIAVPASRRHWPVLRLEPQTRDGRASHRVPHPAVKE